MSMKVKHPNLTQCQRLPCAPKCTLPHFDQSLSLTMMSWSAAGRKGAAHLSFSFSAALHGYHNSAKNISAHHHGGNYKVKSKTMQSQNTRHIKQVLECEQESRDTNNQTRQEFL